MPNNGPAQGSPVVNETYFRVEWQGRRCPLGDTDAFRLLALLLGSNGQPVSHIEIGAHCLSDPLAPSVNIRSLKRRLVARLRAGGLPELAAAIKGAREHYWLSLPSEALSPGAEHATRDVT